MNITEFEVVRLNAWCVDGQWHFDLSTLRHGEFLSALHFKAKDGSMLIEGWLPLRPNSASKDVSISPNQMTVRWLDDSTTTVNFENIVRTYWDFASGHGHTLEDMRTIGVALAKAQPTTPADD